MEAAGPGTVTAVPAGDRDSEGGPRPRQRQAARRHVTVTAAELQVASISRLSPAARTPPLSRARFAGALKPPVEIIMMAFSGYGACPGYLQPAVTQETNLGAIMIAAACNNAQDASLFFPGNCEGTFVIAANTRQGTLASYSNFGPSPIVNFAAPGGDWSNAIMTLGMDQEGRSLEVQFDTAPVAAASRPR
jgi:hypothetical protein